MNHKDIKIMVAMHKEYEKPKDDMYLPLHVGKEVSKVDLNIQGDNEGEHISEKNPYYCELTGLYWAWKNLECTVVGLVHYRRHFTCKNLLQIKMNGKFDSILTEKELKDLREKDTVIVPKARHYYIENLYSHYAHTHYEEHLIKTRTIIAKMYPEYVESYDKVMKQTHGYMFNMFIMDKTLADAYCEWLFSILKELENVIDYKKYDAFQARLFGRVSELLFNVWLEQNQIVVKQVRTMHMEKINWFVKGKAFLKAKFWNKKFEGSF